MESSRSSSEVVRAKMFSLDLAVRSREDERDLALDGIVGDEYRQRKGFYV
jgi:hypothetical protein